MRRLLRVPVASKIAGANALIVVAALVAMVGVEGGLRDVRALWIVGGALAASLLVNVVLVVLALSPLMELEGTAQRIWDGDISARVPRSPLADANIQRVGGALNALLDSISADRSRLHDLTARVLTVGDQERSYIARELHDSTAQSLAALLMELGVALSDTTEPEALQRLQRLHRIASDVLDEVRMLAQTVHPRVLDDLGLGAALQHLAREFESRGSVRVEVVADENVREVDNGTASVMYRVAHEALTNTLRHANARTAVLHAEVRGHVARLSISDDGDGFQLEEAERRRPGMGLYMMRERVALVGGGFEIESAPRQGTRITVSVPLQAPTQDTHAAGATQASGA